MTITSTPALLPYRFALTHSCDEIGSHTSDGAVSIAGRLRRRRDMGGVVFVDVEDASGHAQVFAEHDVVAERLRSLSMGDWIGVSGHVAPTRRGVLSVLADEVVVLAPALRPFPDSWRGITDPELRYRQRELDLWANPDARRTLTARSRMIASLRATLAGLDFLEVETPLLHHQAGGANARPFTTHHNALGCDLELRVAPELFLKRLVVGGFERVFEIGRVFRNEGVSPRHNPEFTILEAYQAYGDVGDMMDLTESLFRAAALAVNGPHDRGTSRTSRSICPVRSRG